MKKASRRKRDLVIVGGGGLGREVIWLAQDCGARWNVIGVLDDAKELQDQTLCSIPVLGRVADWNKYAKADFVIALGAPRTRRAVAARMNAAGEPKFATLIHPSVRMSSFVEIGAGSIVAAGCIVTTQVRIGRHNMLDRMVNIGHDCVLGDFCTVSPMVPMGGNVVLGAGVWIGASASIRQGVRMGAGSMAGMGAVVVKDVPANQLVVGSPARHMKDLEPF